MFYAAAGVAFHGIAVSVLGVAFASKANNCGETGVSSTFSAFGLSFVEGEGYWVVLCSER